MADAVFGGMVEAGWPPAQATRIGALMRYFVTGSALGSFAGGFVGDAEAYDPADYPHLGQAHLLAARREQVDESAFETGLRALVDGLALQYRGAAAARADRIPVMSPALTTGSSAAPDGSLAFVQVNYRKYDGSLHWNLRMRRLGEDEHGVWLGSPAHGVMRKGHNPEVSLPEAMSCSSRARRGGRPSSTPRPPAPRSTATSPRRRGGSHRPR